MTLKNFPEEKLDILFTNVFDLMGTYHQLEVFLQESDELSRAISEYIMGRCEIDEFHTEIADVLICSKEFSWYLMNNIIKDEKFKLINPFCSSSYKLDNRDIDIPFVERWFGIRKELNELTSTLNGHYSSIYDYSEHDYRSHMFGPISWQKIVKTEKFQQELDQLLYEEWRYIRARLNKIILAIIHSIQIDNYVKIIKRECDRKLTRLENRLKVNGENDPDL